MIKTRSDDKVAKREQVATTVADLRRLLEEARADANVWHLSYESRRELVGDLPTACRRGHAYRAGSAALAAPSDWLPCRCGGHHWWLCGCGDERYEPPLAHDCRPRMPQR